ncbi:hypothetical protein [Heliophilum fasciatum]|uniref:Uncharacterized protein n=1 Tax=Heliophilum fasciatum TaxID=35700 RepID=A0A4R2RAV0_9FIRM|nr:hypothetical protein [Heliophilum fasciatum]MCW2279309.1 hypothetical protein [Heliophilum fasciatum]TCP60430.1 hypothetical protein EDD73_13812 [Heliophilum fasciatum]
MNPMIVALVCTNEHLDEIITHAKSLEYSSAFTYSERIDGLSLQTGIHQPPVTDILHLRIFGPTFELQVKKNNREQLRVVLLTDEPNQWDIDNLFSDAIRQTLNFDANEKNSEKKYAINLQLEYMNEENQATGNHLVVRYYSPIENEGRKEKSTSQFERWKEVLFS